MKHFNYSIDVFTNSRIIGWIFDADNPSADLSISVKLYDREIGNVRANLYREDLVQAGVGNGEHGFDFKYGTNLTNDELANIKIECNSLCLESVVQKELQRYTSMISVYLDITDLLNFLKFEKRVTGIQRLVTQLITSLRSRDNSLNYKFVALRSENENIFYEISQEDIDELLNHLQLNRTNLDYDYLIDKCIKNTIKLQPRKHSILLAIGASFSVQNNCLAVRKLIDNYKIYYGTIIYDLIPYHLRSGLPPALCERFSIWLTETVNISDFMICISNYTKKQLNDFIAIQNHNKDLEIVAIPLGSHNKISRSNTDLKSRYFIEQSYCIFVSTIEERKNHLALLSVWERLCVSTDDIPQLVIVGKLGWGSQAVLDKIQSSECLQSKILIISDASDDDLDYLYNHSLFTIYPSRYEGWGLPVTESLFRGKLCICSNSTSIPEAGGRYSEYFDPNDEQSMFSVLSNFLSDRSKIIKAEKNIKKYYKPRSWNDYATDLDLYITNFSKAKTDFYDKQYLIDPGVLYLFESQARSSEVFNDYVLNRATSYLTIEDGEWSIPEAGGRWLLGKYGSLRFSVLDKLNVKIRIYLQYAVVPHQYVGFSIYQKTKFIKKIEYENDSVHGLKSIRFDVVTEGNGSVSLNFRRNHIVSNPNFVDNRDLFIRMISLGVAVTSEQKTDMLENFVFQ